MSGGPVAKKKDLVVLAADKSIEHTLRAVLQRHASLAIRPVHFQVVSYASGLDPGCYLRSHEFLRVFLSDFSHALVVFDHRGSGQECRDARDVEEDVEKGLRQSLSCRNSRPGSGARRHK
jgi:hypothetical protein